MIFGKFKSAVIAEDACNVFGVSQSYSLAPVAMQGFYSEYNPVDVEITYPDYGAVRLYPVEECESLKGEYDLLENDFVFATCNDDPIFLRNNEVYISSHEFYCPEILASSFEDFLNTYIDSVKNV